MTTKRYENELAGLNDVYEKALSIDVADLSIMLSETLELPLTTVGSGGSLSTAAFAATLHEHFTQQIARHCSPLDVLANANSSGAYLCFSASGRNRDIGACFKALCLAEPGPVGALVLAEDTPLHALGRQYDYANVVSKSHPAFKDGFLAVATMIASATLLIRAYRVALGLPERLPNSLDELAHETLSEESFSVVCEWAQEATRQQTVSLLYSPGTKPAAVDLESRFVEAALGNLHVADLRNFGHGRHHWFAKRGAQSSAIAIVGSDWKELANRTLALLPPEVSSLALHIKGDGASQALSALIVGLFVSQAAGINANIDPGKPGVPEFGRKLYRMGPGTSRLKQSDANRNAAIRRKATALKLVGKSGVDTWELNRSNAHKCLVEADFRGIVFDFDGTLCDVKKRWDPLETDIVSALRRMAESDLVLAVATGRGPSAGQRLREALPEKHWDEFIVGYYNGGHITTLADTSDPLFPDGCSDEFVAEVLRLELFSKCRLRSNPVQLTIHLDEAVQLGQAVESIYEIARKLNQKVRIVSSGHSLDILRNEQSKVSVVGSIKERLSHVEGQVLRIGDQGNWPGNDADLLDSPFGLSVDKVSAHPQNCWNFAPAGIKGLQATAYYMNALSFSSKGNHLSLKPGDKGTPRET